jgi:hypothetical protein
VAEFWKPTGPPPAPHRRRGHPAGRPRRPAPVAAPPGPGSHLDPGRVPRLRPGRVPGRPGRRPAPAPHPRKATKTARFLDLVTERHGSLASISLNRVAGISADLAPQLDLNTGTARHIGGVPSTFGWDPIDGCEDPATAIRRADAFAFAVSQKGVEDGSFWSAKASDYLRGYFHAAALADYDLRTVAAWVSGADPDVPERILAAAGPPWPPSWSPKPPAAATPCPACAGRHDRRHRPPGPGLRSPRLARRSAANPTGSSAGPVAAAPWTGSPSPL